MNPAFSLESRSSKVRNCRQLATSSRARRAVLNETLDKQWHEIRRHATIERDPEKLLRLTAELDRGNRQTEALGKRKGN